MLYLDDIHVLSEVLLKSAACCGPSVSLAQLTEVTELAELYARCEWADQRTTRAFQSAAKLLNDAVGGNVAMWQHINAMGGAQ